MPSSSQTTATSRLNLPNVITATRFGFAAIYAWAFLADHDQGTMMLVALVAAILGMISDWADGYLARRMGTGSDFGKLFDPLADALFFVVAFGVMGIANVYPWWLAIPFLLRELLQHLYIRPTALRKGVALGAKQIGKIKTGVQSSVVILICIFLWQLKLKDPWLESDSVSLFAFAGTALAGLLSLASIVPYLKTLAQLPAQKDQASS